MALNHSSEANDYSDRFAYYDIEYVDENDLPFLSDLAHKAKTVLELPCGSGTRTLHLAEAGKFVTAIDREPGMIALLDEKLKTRPDLSVNTMVGDMRQFNVGEKFDMIFVVREAFQFLTHDADILRCLKCLASHLATGGKLIIDLVDFDHNSGDRLRYWNADAKDNVWIDDWTRTVGDAEQLQRKHLQQHHSDNVIQVDFSYQLENVNDSGRNRKWNASVEYRKFEFEEFRAFCLKAGLTSESVYGDYDQRKYRQGDPRLIFALKAMP